LCGEEADQEAFIQAMHVVSREVAPKLIAEINPGGFRRVLDLGGASGSWTLAWLEAEPQASAVIFDLPHVIPMARARLSESRVADRVDFVAGDFCTDSLPSGADLVWVSAIIHQNSRIQNRDLFARIAAAIELGGWIYIRDIVLDASRTAPVAGAVFAVNMLTATPAGNSYTFEEIESDLCSAGFTNVELVRRDEAMQSVVRARR
jgi:spermidine synthase